jgi:hypothetical protein
VSHILIVLSSEPENSILAGEPHSLLCSDVVRGGSQTRIQSEVRETKKHIFSAGNIKLVLV